jgi:hypothetical protein
MGTTAVKDIGILGDADGEITWRGWRIHCFPRGSFYYTPRNRREIGGTESRWSG